MTAAKPVTILSGYIWTGYDQGSQFEAGCRVWLHPMTPNGPTGSVMLGGVYLHKHAAPVTFWGSTYFITQYQNDFYQLQQLRDIARIQGGIHVQPGTTISVDRDIFNIDFSRSFNAWDIELIIVVDE
jgi:hypothetical protein